MFLKRMEHLDTLSTVAEVVVKDLGSVLPSYAFMLRISVMIVPLVDARCYSMSLYN